MRYFILLCFCLSFGGGLYAQQVKEFYDEKWNRTDSAFAKYYRLITYKDQNTSDGIVRDYLITGELQWEGRFSYVHATNKNQDVPDGMCTWYHKNGNKKQQGYYSAGKRDGRHTEWTESGNISRVLHYKSDTLNGLMLGWYPSGLLAVYAVFEGGKTVNSEYMFCSEFGDCARYTLRNFGSYPYGYDDYSSVAHSDGVDETDMIMHGLLTEVMLSGSFQDDISQWTSFPSKSAKMEMTDKGMKIVAPKNSSVKALTYFPVDPANNYYYSAEFDVRKSKDTSSFSLIPSYSDDKNFLRFTIRNDGHAEVGGMKEGKPFILYRSEGNSLSDYYHEKGHYELYVVKEKDSVSFMSSYSQITKIPVKEWFGSMTGFECDAGTEILARSFSVAEEVEAPFVSPDFDAKTGTKGIWKGTGSGFALSEDGYVVTNHHVIDDAKFVEVDIVKDGEKSSYSAEVVVTDKVNDLAIIRIKDENFKGFGTIPYTLKTQLADVGTQVFALGYPLAFSELSDELKFTEGTINSRTGREGMVTAYQVSTPVQPGNSGGPLFDYEGNLLGVINEKIFFADNVAFAIKINYITNLVALLPTTVKMPSNDLLTGKPATDQVKMLREFIPLIKVR